MVTDDDNEVHKFVSVSIKIYGSPFILNQFPTDDYYITKTVNSKKEEACVKQAFGWIKNRLQNYIEFSSALLKDLKATKDMLLLD